MDKIVRSIDVGFGNTKFVISHLGQDIRCASFPSLAYPSAKDPSARSAGERRRTVAVPIDGMFYEVGPDVHLAADAFRATQLHDQYVDTPEYLALARGAMHFMKVPVIDLLVVGLPVAAFLGRRTQLERLMTGEHGVGGGKSVVVRRAVAVAQPQGALVYFAASLHKQRSIGEELSLVVDPGARTFDWLLSRGMRLVPKVSSSVNRGMSDVLRAIAQEISAEIGRPYSDLPAIDAALRSGKPLLLYQRPYDLTPLLPSARAVARRAVASMMEWITEDYSIQNVILVGGGAFMFKEPLKAAFANHKIQLIKDPMFANVKGFQIAGANLVAASSAVADPEDAGDAPAR